MPVARADLLAQTKQAADSARARAEPLRARRGGEETSSSCLFAAPAGGGGGLEPGAVAEERETGIERVDKLRIKPRYNMLFV